MPVCASSDSTSAAPESTTETVALVIVFTLLLAVGLWEVRRAGLLPKICSSQDDELERSLVGDLQKSPSDTPPGLLPETLHRHPSDGAAPSTGEAESPRGDADISSSRRLNLSSAGRQMIPFSEIRQVEPIASGAYGTVYKGHWSSGGMDVALKTAQRSATTGLYSSVRDPAAAPSNGIDSGFAQEIQFNEGAAHRNIVQWCDFRHFLLLLVPSSFTCRLICGENLGWPASG